MSILCKKLDKNYRKIRTNSAKFNFIFLKKSIDKIEYSDIIIRVLAR